MYQIIQPTPDDFDELTCLWEASVRATHHFIPEAYIQKFKTTGMECFIFIVCRFT